MINENLCENHLKKMSYKNRNHRFSQGSNKFQIEHHYHSIEDMNRINLLNNQNYRKSAIAAYQEYWNCEQSIIGARASVMVYDDIQKKWVPSGTSSGLSKVQIYHHQQNNTFRVVGRKLQDHEVVINCSILKGLKYNQATATFHQWRDSKYVYGLNFSSQQDAEAFAGAMMQALEVLSGRGISQSAPPPPQNNPNYEEDMGYRTMTREDAAILQSQQITTVDGRPTPSPQTPTSQNQQNTPQSPPTPQGHHRTSSAPPAPQPPPMSIPIQNYTQQPQVLPQQPQLVNNIVSNPQPIYQSQQSYTSQTSQNSYGSNQNITQYTNNNNNNQPIYVASNSNQSLNQQLQQQISQTNGPIYVASSNGTGGLPTSASNNSVGVYGQQIVIPASAPAGFVQTNGASPYTSQHYIPQPPQMPPTAGPPQAPPPPPAFGGANPVFIAAAPPQAPLGPTPPQPPAGPSVSAPPPPPPPPMGGLSSSKADGLDMNSLAAQLKQAQLKRNQKTTPPPAENSGSSTSSGGSGNYGTIGRSTTGMASMMDEMAKTLARRRAQVEKKEPDPPVNEEIQMTRQRPWEKSNTLPHKLSSGNNITGNNQINSQGTISNTVSTSGPESPRPLRKRFGSASEETILKQVNGDALSLPMQADLDSLKADIIREMRLEINKAKQEIIEAIKSEFNRR